MAIQWKYKYMAIVVSNLQIERLVQDEAFGSFRHHIVVNPSVAHSFTLKTLLHTFKSFFYITLHTTTLLHV